MVEKIMDDFEAGLRSIVAEILEINEAKILPNAKFVEDLGMDSMMALEILSSAEKKFKITIPEEYLTKVTTLGSLADVIRKIKGQE